MHKTTTIANVLLQAIRRSEMARSRTKLVVFLGTPHRGSAYAGWGQIASNLARVALQDSNKKILETLEVNNEVLDNIHEEFKTIAFAGAIKIHSFQEAQGITGMKAQARRYVHRSYTSCAICRPESQAYSCRWWTTFHRNLTSRKRWRQSKALTRTTCRWLGTVAGTTRAIVLSPVFLLRL
jgi:hypothetical protein